VSAQSQKNALFSSRNSDQLFFARCIDALVFRRGLRPVSLQPTAVWDGGEGDMDELVERLVANVGVSRTAAEQSIGIILNFLKKEGPPDKVQALLDKLPGSEAYLQSADAAGDGGMFMSGIMGAGTRMMSAGLSMDQVQAVTRETIAYVREKAGEDAIGEIVGAIPGLGQFI
jgi:hypothetical protein